MNVHDYVVHETERQSGTMREAVGMMTAWTVCVEQSKRGMPWLTIPNTLVHCINGITDYRNTPVYFRSGGHSVNHAVIPRAMENLFEAIQDERMWESEDKGGYTVGYNVPSWAAKEFLVIHPFADGNGRVASLLWNWMRGSLSYPEPLPYFFGEGP